MEFDTFHYIKLVLLKINSSVPVSFSLKSLETYRVSKQDPDTKMASQEAVFLISRATELFVESLAAESSSFTVSNKKKTIARADVDAAIDAVDCLAFLDGALND